MMNKPQVHTTFMTACTIAYTAFLDLLSPPQCTHCLVYLPQRDVFCKECYLRIKPVVSATLQITPTKTAKVFAVSDYKEPLRSLVLAKNYENRLASRQLGEVMWQLTYIQHAPIDYFVPIPLHWTRYARRGFNQSEEMAHVLARKSGKPVAHLLARAKKTQFQAQLAADERAENVKQAFVLSGDKTLYRGKHLVLVDDLYTTGSTARAAAKALLACKPASITVVVACRVV